MDGVVGNGLLRGVALILHDDVLFHLVVLMDPFVLGVVGYLLLDSIECVFNINELFLLVIDLFVLGVVSDLFFTASILFFTSMNSFFSMSS